MGSCTSTDAENIPADQQRPLSFNELPYKIDPNVLNSSHPSQPWISNYYDRGIKTASSLKMPIFNTFQCHECGMIFPSDEALYKHRIRFCVGSKDSVLGRQLHASNPGRTNGYSKEYYPSTDSKLRNIGENLSPIERVRLNSI